MEKETATVAVDDKQMSHNEIIDLSINKLQNSIVVIVMGYLLVLLVRVFYRVRKLEPNHLILFHKFQDTIVELNL